VIRQIPSQIPTVEDLGLPGICTELAAKPRGLVLVTGPTGSGKSTTLAAMIDWINRNRSGHILTMEDPVEFVHEDKNCYVTQRQIGQDCHDFAEALRRALRQDPDTILIGEMRDLETIALAISAAETGHLVFGTLHTTSAISTVDRILDVFPPDQQQQVRVQLSSSLQGVISQCLLPRLGGGRVAAHEILVATSAVRSLIREGKTPQILNVLQTGAKSGMRSLENVLASYVQEGIVDLDDAIAKANRADEVIKLAGDVRRSAAMPDQSMQAMPQDRRKDDATKNLGRRGDDKSTGKSTNKSTGKSAVKKSRNIEPETRAPSKPSGITEEQRESSPALRAFRPKRA
jgi:twitching motility protein PilT